MLSAPQSDEPRDDHHDEQLFAWAVVAPVLQLHYSIVTNPDEGIVACACSPQTPRTIVDWARHVSGKVACSLG